MRSTHLPTCPHAHQSDRVSPLHMSTWCSRAHILTLVRSAACVCYLICRRGLQTHRGKNRVIVGLNPSIQPRRWFHTRQCYGAVPGPYIASENGIHMMLFNQTIYHESCIHAPISDLPRSAAISKRRRLIRFPNVSQLVPTRF